MKLEFYADPEQNGTIEMISKSFGLESQLKEKYLHKGLRRWCFTGTTKTLGWFLWRLEGEKLELK